MADRDGSGEYIEIAELEGDPGRAWHLREPIRELLLPRATAAVAWRAVAGLV